MADSNSEYYIPDDSIQASSEYAGGYYAAIYGRLDSSRCWYPADGDIQPWIETDFGRLVIVSGIKAQGCGVHWVTTLKVSTFQEVSGTEDFIRTEGNEVKVCNV